MIVSRVHRVLRLITLLQGARPRTASDLMRELGVSRRTLFRDLNLLEAAGVPYFHEPGAGYRINKSFFLPPTSLTVSETLGLMVLAEWASAQRRRPMLGPALSAIHKLVSSVPEPMRTACGELMANVSIDPGAQVDGDAEARFYGLLQRCIDEGRACELVYQSPVEDEPLRTVLRPFALHFANRAWYVLGESEHHSEVRMFKLTRIGRLSPIELTFTRPHGFAVAHKLGNAWQLNPEGREYDVVLEFSRKVATNVAEVRWHPTQRHEFVADGRCRMTFRVDGIQEIAWWICGYADQVIVRQPDALRTRVEEMLASALANYRKNASAAAE